MFSQYTWGDLFKVLIPLLVVYYAIVIWKFYRKSIRDKISRRGSAELTAQTEIDQEEEGSENEAQLLYTVRDYPTTAVASAPAPAAKKKARSKPKPKAAPTPAPAEPTEVASGGLSTPSVETEPKFTPVPVFESITPDDLFIAIEGVSIPQGEHPLEDVVNAAMTLEKQEDGTVVASETSDEQGALFAKIFNDQRATALARFQFTR
ncbi:hypothetical protein [Larkinella sp. C7]|uniref:hypothetical protein n=1 Tax=Larkinella sp. C7 TaxID=2576607 RepID=UPI001111088C|nr:hypothetical protein [Larkinella sp. C7]